MTGKMVMVINGITRTRVVSMRMLMSRDHTRIPMRRLGMEEIMIMGTEEHKVKVKVKGRGNIRLHRKEADMWIIRQKREVEIQDKHPRSIIIRLGRV